MKIAAAVVLVLSGMIAALVFFLPISGSILGISYSCGSPIMTVFASTDSVSGFDKVLLESCKEAASPRVVAGAVVGSFGLLSGVVMLVVGLSEEDRRPRHYPSLGSPQYGPQYQSQYTQFPPPPGPPSDPLSYPPPSPWQQPWTPSD